MRNITDLLIDNPLYCGCANLLCRNKEVFINNTYGKAICPFCNSLMIDSFDKKELQNEMRRIVEWVKDNPTYVVKGEWIKTGWDE